MLTALPHGWQPSIMPVVIQLWRRECAWWHPSERLQPWRLAGHLLEHRDLLPAAGLRLADVPFQLGDHRRHVTCADQKSTGK